MEEGIGGGIQKIHATYFRCAAATGKLEGERLGDGYESGQRYDKKEDRQGERETGGRLRIKAAIREE